jgi:hypothetical protein
MTEATRDGLAVNLERVSDEFKRGNLTDEAVATATSQLYAQDAAVVAAQIDLLSRWFELVSLSGEDPILKQIPSRYAR